MFSDLPNHPRVQLVRRRTPPILPYKDPNKSIKPYDPALSRQPDVLGADRLKYFCPIVNFPPKDALHQHALTFTIEKVEKKVSAHASDKKKEVSVETKFRESSAQTEPWEPPYKIIGKGDPEILKLEFLKWGSGLPAGMHEVRLIERARMKAAWEKSIQPDIKNENSLVQFRDYLEALERDEWAFREQEIREIQELRLQLLENMLNEIHEKSQTRTQMKLKHFAAKKEAEKAEQLAKIRKKTARELRKLETQRRGISKKYHEINIIDEHMDKKSEIYGPLIRYGEHPKRWHQVIDEKLKKYKAQFIGVENFSTLPRWIDQATKIGKYELQSKWKGKGLCIRETKWSAPVLKELHKELKGLHKEDVKQPLSLRTKVETTIEDSNTPEVEGIPEVEEQKYQAAILLQKVIKGRAAQIMIYEGRDTCKELILELKHSVGLLRAQKEEKTKQKFKVKAQQREECIQLNMVQRLQGSLGKLQGAVVGTLLDFLNKELRRLLEERKAHAMCLLNERERYIREAAEGGRRQKELRRRREHDEMFKQIVKVTQESVDVYLQDIITEGMEFASNEEANEYVLKLAQKIEKETDEAYKKAHTTSTDKQDEMIADLILHFVLPDVEKKIIRDKISKQQKHNLKTIHESIYSKFESLPKIEPEPTASIIVSEVIENIESRVFNTICDQSSPLELSSLKEYKDPFEEYLARLMADECKYDEDPVGDINDSNDSNEFEFRNDILETITEVDSESSSNKEK
nr:cilia- and flagella-associated protein 91-like [Leptinotarsa decemlineata]